MSDSVAAIVVTYNRKELLIECLHGILSQTKRVEKVFIIDNNSSDGTEALLTEKGFLKFSQVQYFRNTDNTGSSGGFKTGIKLALEAGHDWFWLMDDDVEPTPNCLEKQINFKHISNCIHPIKIFPDGSTFEWEQMFNPNRGISFSLNEISFKNGKNWCPTNIGCFEGMLIHRNIVQKIGLPDERFFMVEDDTFYGFLASLYTNNIYTKEAVFLKKIKTQDKRYDGRFLYYFTRNFILKSEYLWQAGFKSKPFYYLLFLCNSFKNLVRGVFLGKKLKNGKFVIKGFWDGLRGNFGKGI